MVQIYYWIGFITLLFFAMVILVSIERIRQLFVFGLLGGTGLAVVIFYLARMFNLWRIIGGINVLGIPILPSIGWFFPVIIFEIIFLKMLHLFREFYIYYCLQVDQW